MILKVTREMKDHIHLAKAKMIEEEEFRIAVTLEIREGVKFLPVISILAQPGVN